MSKRQTGTRPMLRRVFLALSLIAAPLVADAQTLTAEEIAAMVDERVNALNPYAALLNDPDPQRSLAAMEIMLESGDPTLTRMALEFGLLSPNPTVQRTAVEAYLATGPNLTVQFDGSALEERRRFDEAMTRWLNGAVTADGDGTIQAWVGDFSTEQRCYQRRGENDCLISVTPGGVAMWIGNTMSGNFSITDAGFLEGTADLYQVGVPVPVRIQLID